ncbi:MAG TPA: SCO family protein [Chitinophagaceae bacterium]|nr:SCO family protein [Chitinophagaceae bacterium]
MSKKAVYAILLSVLLPLAGYFVVKSASRKAVQMPGHYHADSVLTTVRKGKEVRDTVWHRVPDFTMVNQAGDTVSLRDLPGKTIVVDFFFTHCPTICPTMTRNMKRLQQSVTNASRGGDRTNRFVHFVSFTIDPERDSVAQLKKWADRFQVNPEQWWLLTGDKKEIYRLAIEEMKIGVEDGQGVDTNFFHTDHFVLIDSNRHVRGYYHGLDSASLARLSEDLILLTLEKDPKRKSLLAGKLPLIAAVSLIALVGVVLLVLVLKKKT